MADELQRAETLRRNLMADIAHELRTPLTVMQGSLRALLDGVYPLELHEIASIYDETRLLSRLVADLRELALAESGQLALNVQAVEVAPVLQATADQFSAAADTQQTRLVLSNTAVLPDVQADPDRLKQVLHNLLTNALRHTTSGTITVSGEALDERIRISVQDTGEGIAPEDLGHVFDRFYRADSSRARSTGGSGLGLAIAKAWVEAMGGTIGVTSQPQHGSIFWFTLRKSDENGRSHAAAPVT
jgi:two-component system OmpR family sensor kinase/two-component system sensor histidine kinase BaeS